MNMTAKSRSLATATLDDPRWAAVVARDAKADGQFFYSVRTTGVYCRPSCAARTPRPENVAFHLTAIEAQGVRSVYVFTRDAIESGSIAHGRYFAPGFGIKEDPVTGSATGVFAGYLARNGVLSLPSSGGVVRARVEQGDVMGKAGRLDIEVTGSAAQVERARVGGVAVTILEGTLR